MKHFTVTVDITAKTADLAAELRSEIAGACEDNHESGSIDAEAFVGELVEVTPRAQALAKMKAEVEATVTAERDRAHQALDLKYNLVRVSERRWRVCRIYHTYSIYQRATDTDSAPLIQFELVTPPLSWEQATAEIVKRRAKGGV